MTRRTILLAPLALAALSIRSRVEITWISGTRVPQEFARESVVFPRAYTCCPAAGPGRKALETGRFPHAAHPQDRTIAMLMGLDALGSDVITVMTAESGDGEDAPFQRSVHVPLAIRWPGKLKPRVADELLISHVDVLPTLVGWLKIAPPEGVARPRFLVPDSRQPGRSAGFCIHRGSTRCSRGMARRDSRLRQARHPSQGGGYEPL